MQSINNFRFVSPLSPFSHDSSTFLYLIFPTPFLVKWLNQLMPTPFNPPPFLFSLSQEILPSNLKYPSFLLSQLLSLATLLLSIYLSMVSFNLFSFPIPPSHFIYLCFSLFCFFSSSFTLSHCPCLPFFVRVLCSLTFLAFIVKGVGIRYPGRGSCNGGGGARITQKDRFG